MMTTLLIACVLIAAVAMLPAVAHALELPGKMRLDRDLYVAVQGIYYPGFTIAGFAELAAIAATLVVAVLAPEGSPEFWLSATAFVALVAMHAVYWFVTHPVNKVWMADARGIGAAGARFFAAGRAGERGDDWTRLRNRWEYSHVARAVLASIAFVALVFALSPAAQ